MNLETDLIYKKIFDWILSSGPSIIVGLIVLIVGFWLIKLFARLLQSNMDKHEFDPSLKPFLISLILAISRVLLVIAVMQIIGIEMTVFVTILGAMSVAVGLALSGTFQNFASGVLILILKPFKVGDNILAQGQEGIVTSIQVFYTVVTTFDNKLVIFPNSKLSNEMIVNISRQGSRRLDIELKIPYRIEFNQLKASIEDGIANTKGVLKKPESRIGVSAFADEFYTVTINLWINSHGFVDLKYKFQEIILSKFKDSGIKLGK